MSWAGDDSLTKIHYFELDESERGMCTLSQYSANGVGVLVEVQFLCLQSPGEADIWHLNYYGKKIIIVGGV